MISVKRVRLSESIVDALKNMIAKEDLRPGERFFSENKLAAMLGVSRASVREAIKILEIAGRVIVLQGKGIFIAPSVSSDPECSPQSQWIQENEKLLLDHFEARLILEARTARHAAECAHPQDLCALERAHEAFQKEVPGARMVALIGADKIFHQTIAQMAGNRTLFSLMKLMTTSLAEGWITSLNVPGRVEKTVEEHGAVLDAIRSGDGKRAEKAMKRHLANALGDIQKAMGTPARGGVERCSG